ncbi:hypothetical protein VW35_07970 [Devosia soli]|uniref:O-antigen ligase-related domain-containing protein n=1 Tax=Devosia soli TaxID=361041 RepID=A0A0F5LDH5_9HYPH|nr:O-antigen ligase family protein [Devosia soli]KKB80325.1 hypothetical protein VW35_07970 [Devosia soli]
MSDTFRPFFVIIALIAILAMAPVAPEAGNILFLTIGLASILFMFRHAGSAFRRPIVWGILLGLLLVAIAYVVGSGTFQGLIGIVYFAPLFAIWPLMAMGHQPRADETAAGLMGVLALSGVAGAAALGISDVAATGTTRAGGIVANPIHYADVALLAGAFSVAGFLFVRSPWRFLFLFGPAFAAVAVTLSGTRGAMVAMALMLFAGWLTMALKRLVSFKVSALVIVGLAIVTGLAVWLGASQLSGVQRVLTDIGSTLSSGLPTDDSTSIRLQMYLGGLRAFLESPIFGQGPLDFVAVADSLADVPFGGAPHLHNDLADFAASAGVLGLVAYGLFMAAPILEVLRLPDSQNRSRLLVLAVTLVTGFFTMGLTNAMFGILTLTSCYAGICIVIGVLADDISAQS